MIARMKYFSILMMSLWLTGCVTDDFIKKVRPDNKIVESEKRYKEINTLLSEADKAIDSKEYNTAQDRYDQILKIDSTNVRAQAGIKIIEMQLRHESLIADARVLFESNETEKAKVKVRPVLIENPANVDARKLIQEIEAKDFKDQITPKKFKPKFSNTVTLEFNDANLKNIFQVIAKTTGINFVFDPAVRSDLRASIFVKDASIEDTIDFLLLMHQLNRKVLTESSVLIYPSSKVGQYDDLILRSFYLNHADAKQTSGLIKQMIPIKDMFIDDKLNMITMKATYDQLRDVEKLIADEDIPEPEVVLDVEVLEVSHSKITDIGMTFPNQVGIVNMNSDKLITLNELRHIGSSNIGLSPNPLINFLRTDSDTTTLANPRIRVKNRESAKIHIGDKIPIQTSTVSSTGNVVGNSANYLDVGLKLDVQPRVMLNNDVSIKVSLEVSNAKAAATANGFPTINTRNTSTVLMTADGETQVLAGLIKSEDLKSASKVPGLSDIPGLGRLFGDENNSKSKTELVLLITPHVVRNISRPEAQNAEFYGGISGGRSSPINFNPLARLQEMAGIPNSPPPVAIQPALAPIAPAPVPSPTTSAAP